jgi:O-methyltransferase
MNFATLRTTRMPWVEFAKGIIPPLAWQFMFKTLVVKDIPNAELYRPCYSPWLSVDFQQLYRNKVEPFTVVTLPRAWTLWRLLRQSLNLPGNVMEAGVFQGGTARLLREAIGERTDRDLYLFDSFEGMARTDTGLDRHKRGDFADTSVESVRKAVGEAPFAHFCKGWIPDSFAGLDDVRLCFAHIDLDLYQGVFDTLNFVYPRLSIGGVIVLDDYGFASCPGARRAVDEFFADKPEEPLALQTGQAVIHKL